MKEQLKKVRHDYKKYKASLEESGHPEAQTVAFNAAVLPVTKIKRMSIPQATDFLKKEFEEWGIYDANKS